MISMYESYVEAASKMPEFEVVSPNELARLIFYFHRRGFDAGRSSLPDPQIDLTESKELCRLAVKDLFEREVKRCGTISTPEEIAELLRKIHDMSYQQGNEQFI